MSLSRQFQNIAKGGTELAPRTREQKKVCLFQISLHNATTNKIKFFAFERRIFEEIEELDIEESNNENNIPNSFIKSKKTIPETTLSQAQWAATFFLINPETKKFHCTVKDPLPCTNTYQVSTSKSNLFEHIVKKHRIEPPPHMGKKPEFKKIN